MKIFDNKNKKKSACDVPQSQPATEKDQTKVEMHPDYKVKKYKK